MKKFYKILFGVAAWIIFLLPISLEAQLSAPGSAYSEMTSYPVHPEQDPVFVFCAGGTEPMATLLATTSLEGYKTWTWEKYNPVNLSFEFYFQENDSNRQHQIRELENGCYRVNIVKGDTAEVYRAWVFNDRISVSAEITDSNCDFFALRGTVVQTQPEYYDLTSGQPVELVVNQEVEWSQGETIVSRTISPGVYDPPAKDTEYRFVARNRFGCESEAKVTYESIVPKASFTADPMTGEAPLEVTFTNTSENSDAWDWWLFRDIDAIKRDFEKTTQKVDTTIFNNPITNKNPVFKYENSGSYMVKLIAKKTTGSLTCKDSVYLKYIVVDTSYFAVPNVFTPNGDGTNDNFVVKFWSMKEVKISIFNRWGRRVHFWESGKVEGFEKTYIETVWDGRIGGRMASPGVYFYVVEGRGRDLSEKQPEGIKRWKHGNVYLIRDKDKD